MPNFGDMVTETLAFKSIKGEGDITGSIYYKALNKICVRFQNKYINNIDKHRSLKESIRVNGLIEPIVVVDIDEYLTTCSNKEEADYLSEMKKNGCEYFISSGHRRFKAYTSLCLKRDIYTDEDLKVLYSDEFKKILNEKDNEVVNIDNLFDDTPDWTTIPCKIISLENETSIYNDSNTTQREITAFEIIDNAMDEMKQNGTWLSMIEDVKTNRIDSMTDRAVKDNIKKLKQSGMRIECGDKIEDQRAYLKTLDVEMIPGTDSYINKRVADYILQNKQRNVSASAVNYTRRILSTFSDKLIRKVYDGFLSFREAQKILDNYSEIDENEIIQRIDKGTFDIKEIEQSKRRIRFSERQLIEYLYDIKNGQMTVDEVIKIIEDNKC